MRFERIPGVNRYGHGVPIGAKVQGQTLERIQAWVQTGQHYRNNSDLIRHAIDRHLDYLDSLEPGRVEAAPAEVLSEITAYEFRMASWAQAVEDARKVMESYLSHGHNGDAARLYANLQEMVANMSEGELKTQALNVLNSYNVLAPASGTVSLRPSEMTE